VLVIGGGNSAGQAAIYLAQHNCRVTIAIRRQDLTASSFIGARPATAWLGDSVLLDEDGFILTDRQLPGALSAESTRCCRSRHPRWVCSPPATFATAR